MKITTMSNWVRDNTGTIVVIGGGLLLLWIITRGPAKFAGDVARTAVAAGGEVVKGVVDEGGQAVGLPALENMTTDPYVARYIMDHPNGGQLDASIWASLPAFAQAQFLPQYSGHMPPLGSVIYNKFPPNVVSINAG
jgi:hypothetical protein